MATLVRENAVWTWFHDPRAIRDGQTTYLTWNATDGIYVGAYDHGTGDLDAFRLMATPTIPDDHDVAAIGIRQDGRILAAYSAHNDTDMRVRVSVSPGDVTAWGSEQSVATGGITYPNLAYLQDEGRWYLLYRQNTGYTGRPPAYVTSTDDGDTWGSELPLTTAPADERPYLKMVSDGRASMHFLVTDRHPNTSSGVPASVYHFWYDAGTWRDSAGNDLGAGPIAHSSMTLVNDGNVTNSWVWDIALDGGNPVIAYTIFPSDDDHRYMYGRTQGGGWDLHEITPGGDTIDGPTEPYYSGGLMFDHAGPSTVYLSRQVEPSAWDLERWVTEDGGSSWTSAVLATNGKHMRPVSVRGTGPEAVIWFAGDYAHFNTYATDLFYVEPSTTPGPTPDGGGLPQVAQAVIRNRLTWLSCNLSDGAVITELPDLQGDEVSRVIGEYTSANLSLPIPAVGGRDLELAQRAQLAIQSTQPPRTKIVAVVNDVPAWEGIPLPRDLGTDAAIPLGCVSMEGYLRHVYIGDHTFNEQDVALIADGILRDAVTTPHGPGIALVIDAPNIGTIASREYLDIDNQTVYAGLTELMKAGLMEWTLEPDWRMGFPYRIVDTIARVRGQLGKSEPTAVFQSATFSSQGASDARYALKEDYGDDRYANVVRLHGAGEGEDQLRSAAAIDQAQIDAGVPVWELRDSAPQNVEQQALLDLHAERRLDRVRDGAQTLEITARWDAPGARLGVDWQVGDLVRHELVGHAHPSGLNGVRRAIGFHLSIQRGTIRPILQDEDEEA